MSGVADILGISQFDEAAGFSHLRPVKSVVTSAKGGPCRPLGSWTPPTSLQEPHDHSLALPLQKCCHSQVTGCKFTPGICWGENYSSSQNGLVPS